MVSIEIGRRGRYLCIFCNQSQQEIRVDEKWYMKNKKVSRMSSQFLPRGNGRMELRGR